MNISHILENLGENRADFIEALSQASHLVGHALDLLTPKDRHNSLMANLDFFKACDAFDRILAECWGDDDDDAGDKALQEAYDIIATDDIDPTDTEQLATELMRGWN